jgi:hypothetical protein
MVQETGSGNSHDWASLLPSYIIFSSEIWDQRNFSPIFLGNYDTKSGKVPTAEKYTLVTRILVRLVAVTN